MTKCELWQTIIKYAVPALGTTDGARPSQQDVEIVAARTMMLFAPECDHSQAAARSTSSLSVYTLLPSFLASRASWPFACRAFGTNCTNVTRIACTQRIALGSCCCP